MHANLPKRYSHQAAFLMESTLALAQLLVKQISTEGLSQDSELSKYRCLTATENPRRPRCPS